MTKKQRTIKRLERIEPELLPPSLEKAFEEIDRLASRHPFAHAGIRQAPARAARSIVAQDG